MECSRKRRSRDATSPPIITFDFTCAHRCRYISASEIHDSREVITAQASTGDGDPGSNTCLQLFDARCLTPTRVRTQQACARSERKGVRHWVSSQEPRSIDVSSLRHSRSACLQQAGCLVLVCVTRT